LRARQERLHRGRAEEVRPTVVGGVAGSMGRVAWRMVPPPLFVWGVRAHVRCAATALYSRRHDTTVPARTEPRALCTGPRGACGSPPFGSRSLALASVRMAGILAAAGSPVPSPSPAAQGGDTADAPARMSSTGSGGGPAVREGGLRSSLQRLQSPAIGGIVRRIHRRTRGGNTSTDGSRSGGTASHALSVCQNSTGPSASRSASRSPAAAFAV
jgi:hypothetical protein